MPNPCKLIMMVILSSEMEAHWLPDMTWACDRHFALACFLYCIALHRVFSIKKSRKADEKFSLFILLSPSCSLNTTGKQIYSLSLSFLLLVLFPIPKFANKTFLWLRRTTILSKLSCVLKSEVHKTTYFLVRTS